MLNSRASGVPSLLLLAFKLRLGQLLEKIYIVMMGLAKVWAY